MDVLQDLFILFQVVSRARQWIVVNSAGSGLF